LSKQLENDFINNIHRYISFKDIYKLSDIILDNPTEKEIDLEINHAFKNSKYKNL